MLHCFSLFKMLFDDWQPALPDPDFDVADAETLV